MEEAGGRGMLDFGRIEGAVLLLGHSDFQTLHHLWGYNEYGTITTVIQIENYATEIIEDHR